MSFNLIHFSLIFLVLAPSCSSHNKHKTPAAQFPSSSHSSPPYSPILKKRKKGPPPTPPPPPPPPPVTPFDYFKLAETWPTSFCLVNNCAKPPSPPLTRFTIHGLWPSNKTNPQPRGRDCASNENFDFNNVINGINGNRPPIPLSDFRKFWPNLLMADKTQEYKLWINQWIDHGKCSSMYAIDFYKLAFQIYHKHPLINLLSMKGISPGGTERKSQEIFDAIKIGIGGFDPEIVCEMHQNKSYLVEIRVCLDKKGAAYTDCAGPGPVIQCPAKVYYP